MDGADDSGRVHAVNHRRQHPLVTAECSALPESLMESELFGHDAVPLQGQSESADGAAGMVRAQS